MELEGAFRGYAKSTQNDRTVVCKALLAKSIDYDVNFPFQNERFSAE
jgi:hypothetical protein